MKIKSKITIRLWTAILIVSLASAVSARDQVHIIVPEKAGPVKKYAAKELTHYLTQMYPGTSFVNSRVVDISSTQAQTIYVGTVQDTPTVLRENWQKKI